MQVEAQRDLGADTRRRRRDEQLDLADDLDAEPELAVVTELQIARLDVLVAVRHRVRRDVDRARLDGALDGALLESGDRQREADRGRESFGATDGGLELAALAVLGHRRRETGREA